jgi:hypothetical protein
MWRVCLGHIIYFDIFNGCDCGVLNTIDLLIIVNLVKGVILLLIHYYIINH